MYHQLILCTLGIFSLSANTFVVGVQCQQKHGLLDLHCTHRLDPQSHSGPQSLFCSSRRSPRNTGLTVSRPRLRALHPSHLRNHLATYRLVAWNLLKDDMFGTHRDDVTTCITHKETWEIFVNWRHKEEPKVGVERCCVPKSDLGNERSNNDVTYTAVTDRMKKLFLRVFRGSQFVLHNTAGMMQSPENLLNGVTL